MGSVQERRPFRDADSTALSSSSSSSTKAKVARKPPRRAKNKGVLAGLFKCLPGGLLSLTLIFLLSFILIAFLFRKGGLLPGKPTAITPLPVPKVTELPMFQGSHREDMFWGTYRPNLYLGIRSRTPKSLLAGLMWLGINNGVYSLRHTCEDADNLNRYGWLRHDGISYGRQELVDQNILIQTSFLKRRDLASGYGGDWAVRVRVENLRSQVTNDHDTFSLFFYLADEAGETMHIWPKGYRPSEEVFASGLKRIFGGWEVHLRGMGEGDVSYAGFQTLNMHNLTQLVSQALQIQAWMNGRMRLPDAFEASPNVAVLQLIKKIPFEVDLVFVSGVNAEHPEIKKRVDNLAGVDLSRKMAEKESAFETRFQEVFNLNEKALDIKSVEVGRAAISNLLGGSGYFFGQSRIAVPSGSKDQNFHSYWNYWPAPLFTAVPSRSFFPRGFLWDEGFHQLLIRRWNRRLSMEIIAHWLDLINIDGWIPREQILGSEALSKVPEEFVLQHTSNANPPTLFLVFREFVADMENLKGGDREEVKAFLKRSFPRLEAWYRWFNTTQVGSENGSYFWHGRDSTTDRELNPKTLTSGLDDYPRASHPNEFERHVDLRCWMFLAANTTGLISQLVGVENQQYEAASRELSDLELLNKLHFDPTTGQYCDYGNHTEHVRLQWKIVDDGAGPRSQLVRMTLEQPQLQLVPHFGYVSLFPFLMKLIPPDSAILGKQLELIRDEKLLWTDYGLRSLAKTSSLYMEKNTQHDAPYWRGPVWINLNYLVIASLHHYSREPGRYKNDAANLYMRLRENLIRNIVERYYESGFLWEQYDNVAGGKGKGAHPFTGWTSLILLIMAEHF